MLLLFIVIYKIWISIPNQKPFNGRMLNLTYILPHNKKKKKKEKGSNQFNKLHYFDQLAVNETRHKDMISDHHSSLQQVYVRIIKFSGKIE